MYTSPRSARSSPKGRERRFAPRVGASLRSARGSVARYLSILAMMQYQNLLATYKHFGYDAGSSSPSPRRDICAIIVRYHLQRYRCVNTDLRMGKLWGRAWKIPLETSRWYSLIIEYTGHLLLKWDPPGVMTIVVTLSNTR